MDEYEIISVIRKKCFELRKNDQELLKHSTNGRTPLLDLILNYCEILDMVLVFKPLPYEKKGKNINQEWIIKTRSRNEIISMLIDRRKELAFEIKYCVNLLDIPYTAFRNCESDIKQIYLEFLLRWCRLLWIEVAIEENAKSRNQDT